MERSGSTIGGKSGSFRRFAKGDEIEAPKGEFDHLPSAEYRTTMIKPENRKLQAENTDKPKKSKEGFTVAEALAYIEDHPDLDVAAFIEGDTRTTLIQGIPGERIAPATGGK